MKNSLYLLSFISSLIFISCSTVSVANYSVGLQSVESPVDAKTQFGETKVVNFDDNGISKYRYEDDYIDIVWFVDSDRFNFDLKNKTDHTLRINWDDISYVNYAGQVKRVIHSGIKYSETSSIQPATNIPKGTSLVDVLVPDENIEFIGDELSWKVDYLIPSVYKTPEEFNAEDGATSYVGKTLKIVMPIMIQNVQNDYIFTFKIEELLNSVYSKCKIVNEN